MENKYLEKIAISNEFIQKRLNNTSDKNRINSFIQKNHSRGGHHWDIFDNAKRDGDRKIQRNAQSRALIYRDAESLGKRRLAEINSTEARRLPAVVGHGNHSAGSSTSTAFKNTSNGVPSIRSNPSTSVNSAKSRFGLRAGLAGVGAAAAIGTGTYLYNKNKNNPNGK